MAVPALKFDGPPARPCDLVLAHGAGQPMDSPFMDAIAEGIAARGHRICRFEFPYMEAYRKDGRRRAPDSAMKLIEAYKAALDEIEGSADLIIGGKSLGGRIASLIADEVHAKGLICLGYPFHPPGKPEKLRVQHLAKLRTRALIIQGTRDTFGKPSEVEKYILSSSVHITWVDDGDHSFKPRKSSGRTLEEAQIEAVKAILWFIRKLSAA